MKFCISVQTRQFTVFIGLCRKGFLKNAVNYLELQFLVNTLILIEVLEGEARSHKKLDF